MNHYIPEDQDDFSDVPAGPGDPTRRINLNDAPADPDFRDGCALTLARGVAVAAMVAMIWRIR